jgi:hypothetical protein
VFIIILAAIVEALQEDFNANKSEFASGGGRFYIIFKYQNAFK